MASTDLITYLNYVSTWETESDANLDSLILEQNLFIKLNDFDASTAIDQEFKTLVDLAKDIRDMTVAEDAIKMSADAAAIASLWSFGLGMAAFAALEAAAAVDQAIISSKSKELNKKLTTVDLDIASKIDDNVNSYVKKYKENNNLIISKAPKGLDTKQCRSILMQFMTEVHRRSKKLDAVTMRKYAESARILYHSDEINKIYDALDELNLSDKKDTDVKKFMKVLKGFKIPQGAVLAKEIITGVSIAILAYKMKIAKETIKKTAEAEDIPVEEVETNAFEAMDAVGKVTGVVVVLMSVIDIVLDILDIVDIVKQTSKMCDKLDGEIKENYKSYFNGIKEASIQYNKAIVSSS